MTTTLARPSSSTASGLGRWSEVSRSSSLRRASEWETPTHMDTCPDCQGQGRRLVGSVDDMPLYERCWRCNGRGSLQIAVLIKGSKDGGEFIRWNPDEPIEPESFMRLRREENNVSR